MNKEYIENAIVKQALIEAWLQLDKVYHIYNDGSPESISNLETIRNAQDTIDNLRQMLIKK